MTRAVIIDHELPEKDIYHTYMVMICTDKDSDHAATELGMIY